jgi:hypothetical protein
LEQLRVATFQPVFAVSRFITPLLCVAALKAVVLYPAPWQVEQATPSLLWVEW